MRPAISPTHTNTARYAVPLRPSTSSTARQPARREVGHGTVSASNVDAMRARLTVRAAKMCGTLGCESGGAKIQRRLLALMRAAALNRSTDSRLSRLRRCGSGKAAAARSVHGQHRAFSWIIATRRGMSAHSSAKRAIHSLDGMRRKQIRSFDFRDIWRIIARSDQPCHADVLLEMANAEPPRG